MISFDCHGKRQFPVSMDTKSSPRRSATSFSGPVTEGPAVALFLDSNLRARLAGALDDAASLILILDMDGVVEWMERLERDLVREGTWEGVESSSACTMVLSTELDGESLEVPVRTEGQVDRYEDGPGMDDQSSML